MSDISDLILTLSPEDGSSIGNGAMLALLREHMPDLAEDDYVIFHGAGAYSMVTNTRFNGFGAMTRATVMGFE